MYLNLGECKCDAARSPLGTMWKLRRKRTFLGSIEGDRTTQQRKTGTSDTVPKSLDPAEPEFLYVLSYLVT